MAFSQHFTLNSHHEIVHCKFNLNTDYSLPYEILVWGYKKANQENIIKSVDIANWKTIFANKNVHEQVNIIHKVLNNFFLILRFIPNKNLTFDDKVLTWMNELVKGKNGNKEFVKEFDLKKH